MRVSDELARAGGLVRFLRVEPEAVRQRKETGGFGRVAAGELGGAVGVGGVGAERGCTEGARRLVELMGSGAEGGVVPLDEEAEGST